MTDSDPRLARKPHYAPHECALDGAASGPVSCAGDGLIRRALAAMREADTRAEGLAPGALLDFEAWGLYVRRMDVGAALDVYLQSRARLAMALDKLVARLRR